MLGSPSFTGHNRPCCTSFLGKVLFLPLSFAQAVTLTILNSLHLEMTLTMRARCLWHPRFSQSSVPLEEMRHFFEPARVCKSLLRGFNARLPAFYSLLFSGLLQSPACWALC